MVALLSLEGLLLAHCGCCSAAQRRNSGALWWTRMNASQGSVPKQGLDSDGPAWTTDWRTALAQALFHPVVGQGLRQALQPLLEPANLLGLPHIERRNIGLDVQHRRAIEHIVAAEMQRMALHPQQPHDG